jgi:hypothetical protein
MKNFLLGCVILVGASPALALSPGQAVTAALADLDRQAVEDAVFYRYLYLPADLVYLPTFEKALRLHVNLISREARFAYPLAVGEGLWRVDLRDYQWDPRVFEKLAGIDVYFHRQQITIEEVRVPWPGGTWKGDGYYYAPNSFYTYHNKKVVKSLLYAPLSAGQLASLALLTHSNVPIVRADWFLVQGARQISLTNRETGAGYYDWLGLKDRDDFFRLIGEDQRTFLRIQSEVRAVVGESGVTAQNRQIVRTGAQAGGHWTTLEVADQSGRGIAIQELRRNELLHVAEEHYGPLANGLPATFLSNDQGVRQDSVPDTIAGDKSPLNVGNDTRVHVNLACMRCHNGDVLRNIADDVRPVYTGKLNVLSNDKGVALELARQYGASIDRVLKQDRALYQEALTQVTGKTPVEAATLYAGAFNRYAYTRVTLAAAASELGTTPERFLKSLRDSAERLGRADFRLDPFLVEPPRTIPRLNWEDAFIAAEDLFYGILVETPATTTPTPKEP